MKLKITPGEWNIWEGPQYVGGAADLCIGAGKEWVANMDHRQPRCPQIMSDGHNDEQCDICTIDSGNITDEQRANALAISRVPKLLALLVRLAEVKHASREDDTAGVYDHYAHDEARALLEGLVEE